MTTVAAVAVFTNLTAYRNGEARVEAYLVNTLTPVRTIALPHVATVFTGFGTNRAEGFTVTPLCSSGLLVGGFLAVTAVVLAFRAWRLRAVAAALSVAAVMVLAANLIRLSLVIWATRAWNQAGFKWTHVYAGTLITFIGLTAAVIAYFVLLGRGRPLALVNAAGDTTPSPRTNSAFPNQHEPLGRKDQ